MPCSNSFLQLAIPIAARSSRLSKIQVTEVLQELNRFHPCVTFIPNYFETTGDLDQKTSLRELGSTPFFTKEIDEAVLNGQCRLGIHSAKDLPDSLEPGLSLICLTNGLDPSDSLVLRQGISIDTLPKGAKIATSSIRREENLLAVRPDLCFQDVRGVIEKRLELLDSGRIDGVIIAEAALIRLNLTHLNRVLIPGPTAKWQGRLAVTARKEDAEMRYLFASFNSLTEMSLT